MTQRDPIAEWRRAIEKRELGFVRRPVDALDQTFTRVTPLASDTIATDLSKTRAISAEDMRRRMDWRGDLGSAIRTFQRHNKRLESAFGITWVDATNLVMGESHRRALPASTMARAITARLPRDGGAR